MRRACRVALSLLVVAPSLGAQFAVTREAPLRFAVAWARGAPQGEFAAVTDPPSGFVAWLSMPVTRNSTVGLRAEFSVLTVPEQFLSVPLEGGGDLEVTARGTVGFTGVGPRLEFRAGPFSLSTGVMAGYTRVITDATGQVLEGGTTGSVAASESDYAFAAKASGDLYFPVYRGARGTAVAVTGGLDYLTGGDAAFPRRDSFRVGGPGVLELDRPQVRPTMVIVRAGVSVEF
jgi:hypothetical protein